MDFIAIDFETANRRRDSACQLAAVVVRSGKIVDTAMWMIRPEPFYFSPANIGIHGISPAMVEHEPTFAGHWPDVARFLQPLDLSPEGSGRYDCIIAHNASFDVGVLLGSMDSHGIEHPEFSYGCTRLIARQTWPGRSGYGLKPLAQWLGIEFRHHDALEDSVACAKILIAAAIQRGVTSLEELESTLAISRGSVGPAGKKGPTSLRRARRTTTRSYNATPRKADISREFSPPYARGDAIAQVVDVQRLMVRASFIRSLAGECISFTGVLRKISRPDAEGLARCLGGQPQASLTSETTVLVVGDPEEGTLESDPARGASEANAERMRSRGHSIRIMSEDQFLGLIV